MLEKLIDLIYRFDRDLSMSLQKKVADVHETENSTHYVLNPFFPVPRKFKTERISKHLLSTGKRETNRKTYSFHFKCLRK